MTFVAPAVPGFGPVVHYCDLLQLSSFVLPPSVPPN